MVNAFVEKCDIKLRVNSERQDLAIVPDVEKRLVRKRLPTLKLTRMSLSGWLENRYSPLT